jgi:hypothetical protein
MLTNPEDISESNHCKNIKFENIDKFQLKMVHPGLVHDLQL